MLKRRYFLKTTFGALFGAGLWLSPSQESQAESMHGVHPAGSHSNHSPAEAHGHAQPLIAWADPDRVRKPQ